ncbi:MAG: hypothetical protein HY804_12545 [Nitrospinae bacterium]|nr:hypothetical protein [Nitrospinota bacterium]
MKRFGSLMMVTALALAMGPWFTVSAEAQSLTAEGRNTAFESAIYSYFRDSTQTPAGVFERASFLRDLVDRGILSVNERNPLLSYAGERARLDMLRTGDTGGDSLTELRFREALARDHAYQAASGMLMQIKVVARLRDALEPYTRPFELYRTEAGEMVPAYFAGAGEAPAGERMFSLILGISPAHNLNVMTHFAGGMEMSLIDGTRFIALYPMGDNVKVGFERDQSDATLLRFGVDF